MIDTLHLEIPRGSNYTKSFLGAMSKLSPETERRMIQRGRDYSQVIDLRYLDIPALQHVGNVYSRDAGDKFEFIGAGALNLSAMVGYIREVYLTDAEECGVMRMDLTADLDGSFVPWCRENVRVAGKQCVQAETPEPSVRELSVRELSQRNVETIYWGKKPHQTKVYDKTGERRFLLQKKRNKMTRSERAAIGLETHFEREYGYSMFWPVTRFERQMGAREGAKVFGIDKFGLIEKAAFIDPFDRMQFPEQALAKGPGRIPRGLDMFTILYLRDLIKRDGITNARNAMFRAWGRRVFYPRWNAILPLLLPSDDSGLRREEVRKAYVGSTLQQFAA